VFFVIDFIPELTTAVAGGITCLREFTEDLPNLYPPNAKDLETVRHRITADASTDGAAT
jgi:hypothetical protein